MNNLKKSLKTLKRSSWLPIEDLSFFSKADKNDFTYTYEEVTVYIDVLIVGIASIINVSESDVEVMFQDKNRSFYKELYSIFETSTICSAFNVQRLFAAFSQILLPFPLAQILENNYMYTHWQAILKAHQNDFQHLNAEVSADELFNALLELPNFEKVNFIENFNDASLLITDLNL